MPRRIIENALAKYNQSNPIRVYGDNAANNSFIRVCCPISALGIK
jgi:hypothetical protein